MLKKILLLLLLGIVLAEEQKRFLFGPDQNPFPNSPFGGGGSGGGGVSSPFGSGSGSGGMTGTGAGSSYTACVPQQAMCSLQCDNGYVKGPRGCDFCMCNVHTQTSVTTAGSVLIDPVDAKGATYAPFVPQVSTQGPTASSNTATDDCMAAKLACTSTCGNDGYLVDPSDCTFCLCKSSH